MFQALMPFLQQCKQLDIKLVPDGDRISVVVFPTPKDGQTDAALRLPLAFDPQTPEALDAEFVDALARHAAVRRSLIESIEVAETVMQAAKAEADKKAVKAISGKPAKALRAPAKAGPAATSGDDDDAGEGGGDGGDDDDAVPVSTVVNSKPAVAQIAAGADNPFAGM